MPVRDSMRRPRPQPRRRRTRTRRGIDYRKAMKVLRPEMVASYDRTPRQLELFDPPSQGKRGQRPRTADPHIRNRQCPTSERDAYASGVDPNSVGAVLVRDGAFAPRTPEVAASFGVCVCDRPAGVRSEVGR